MNNYDRKKLSIELKEVIISEYPNLQILNITPHCDKTINEIFILSTMQSAYIVKYFSPSMESKAINSIVAQSVVSKYNLAPHILLNKSNVAYTYFNSGIFFLQEYIKNEGRKIDTSVIKLLAQSVYKLHEHLASLDASKLPNKHDSKDTKAINSEIVRCIRKYTNLSGNKVSEEMLSLANLKYSIALEKNIEYTPQIFRVIHGDIRPSNVIYNQSQVYFIDFDYISHSDYLFDIGYAAMLLSDYNCSLAQEFMNEYTLYAQNSDIICCKTFTNLLGYYIQSSFPEKLLDEIEEQVAIDMINDRKKALNFCTEIIKQYS